MRSSLIVIRCVAVISTSGTLQHLQASLTHAFMCFGTVLGRMHRTEL